MANPRFDRIKVLAWYESLKETLTEAGIDYTNPAQLSRIRAYQFKPSTNPAEVGDIETDTCTQMYAFMKKKFNEKKEPLGYVVGEPGYPSASVQERLDAEYIEYQQAFSSHLVAIDNLTAAYKKGASEAEIEELENAEKEAEQARYTSFKTFNEDYNDSFKDNYQWTFSNPGWYDPETDYDQIEDLYKAAYEGRLVVRETNKDLEDRWQLTVGGDGSKSLFSRTGADKQAEAVNGPAVIEAIKAIRKGGDLGPADSFYNKVKACLDRYEAEHGLFPRGLVTEFTEQPPAEVPKPGFWSWTKRIISFGAATGDFTKYDDYQAALGDYNLHKKAHEKRNREVYDKIFDFINKNKDELGVQCPDDMQNVAEVENNRIRIHSSQFRLGGANPEKGIHVDRFEAMKLMNDAILEDQISNDPTTINPDGTINVEKTSNHWKDKDWLPLVYQKDQEKTFGKLNKAKFDSMVHSTVKQGLNNELADMQQETLLKETARQKIEEKNETIDFAETKLLLKGMTKKEAEEVMNTWTSASVDVRIKQIGTLFGASPKDAWTVGINTLATCVTRNQEYNLDGTERDYSKLRTDHQILEDLNKLLDIASHPEKAAENKEFLEDLKKLKDNTQLSSSMFVDSVASILSTHEAFNGAKEAKELGAGLFVCAQLSYRYFNSEKNPQGVKVDEDFKVEGEKNLTLSDKDQRQRLFDLGKECFQIGQIVAENKKAVKERDNIRTELKKGTYGVDAPDLNLKRKQNIDLAKEPGLYH